MAKGKPSKPIEGKITTDPRFARLHTDPRFLKPKKEDTKVVVDERFKSIFEEGSQKGGKNKTKTDRYGRKIGKGQSDVDYMKRFYRLQDGDDEEQSETAVEEGQGTEEVIDYARGEGDLESSSDEESSSESEDDGDDSEDDEEEDSSDDEDVMIGPSSVLDRERRKNQQRQKASSSSRFDEDTDDDDDDGLGSDIGEIDLDEDAVDDSVYAQLDAQAERAVAQGGIEGEDDSDDDQEAAASAASSSRKAAKSKSQSKVDRARSVKSSSQRVPRGDDTNRLAVVNLDWDHVRAKDIYKIFSSIVSPTASISAAEVLKNTRAAAKTGKNAPAISIVRGKIFNVRVYPSDFGKERMAREDIEGPPKEIFKSSSKRNSKGKGRSDDSDGEEEDDEEEEEEVNEKTIIQVDEGGEFDEEALRKYQLDRLRYYYAVATFDSKETARHVYNEIDGTEMERTANVFDLRFVPEGMDFPDGEEGRDAEFRDEATEEDIKGTTYKGVDFKTDALRHSKVKLTWDQDDPERTKLTRLVAKGGLTKDQLREDDFKAYLASDTEDEEDDEQGLGDSAEAGGSGRDRLRALLNLDGKGKGKNRSVFDDPTHDDDDEDEEMNGGKGEMQITFLPGLSESAANKQSRKKKSGEEETTLDKYLRKQKEKKEKRKAKQNGAAEAEEDQEPGIKTNAKSVTDPADATEDAGFDDPFFMENDGMDMEAALAAEYGDLQPSKSKNKSKSKTKTQSHLAGASSDGDDAASLANLRSVIGGDDEEKTAEGRQHFDLKDILRLESGKDAKREKLMRKLSRKKQREEEKFQAMKGKPLIQDGFEVNAKDDRFTEALTQDHRFAIDPTHPSFTKTKGMQKILSERRKVLDSHNNDDEAVNGSSKNAGKSTNNDNNDDLAGLVERLKRKTESSNASSSSNTKKAKLK